MHKAIQGNLPIISQKKGVAKKRVSKTERQKVLDIFFNSNNCFGVLSLRAILRKRIASWGNYPSFVGCNTSGLLSLMAIDAICEYVHIV